MYITHPDYADSPGHFIRAYLIIQKDLMNLFDYIEPSDCNLKTHSFRVHELLLRTCVEFEANCTAILRENDYPKPEKDLTINDYKKIEQSHFLSQYQVQIPNWIGTHNQLTPFSPWASGDSLSWYKAYNQTKHDRHKNFKEARFGSLIMAVCGLAALMASQFWKYDFSSAGTHLEISPRPQNDGFESSIGGVVRIKYPLIIKPSQQYDFDYKDIDFTKDIFQKNVYK